MCRLGTISIIIFIFGERDEYEVLSWMYMLSLKKKLSNKIYQGVLWQKLIPFTPGIKMCFLSRLYAYMILTWSLYPAHITTSRHSRRSKRQT